MQVGVRAWRECRAGTVALRLCRGKTEEADGRARLSGALKLSGVRYATAALLCCAVLCCAVLCCAALLDALGARQAM